MIDDAVVHTRKLHVETTNDLRPCGGVARLLEIAVRRCVRNAAGQPSPRNRFEHYVSRKLNTMTSDHSAHSTSRVSRLTSELCERIRERDPEQR
jgi:hypothetical protein